jgi:prepilin-type N-terminal cleavage/methylation domain-containing protein
VLHRELAGKVKSEGRQHGFSVAEMMITLVILLAVAGIVMGGMVQMTNTQGTIANRTAMHSSVRDATELLQQEIGQAGKIAVPTAANGGPTKMTTAITAAQIVNTDTGYTGAVVLDGVAGLYNNMLLVIDSGDQEETVAVTSLVPSTKTFTGTFFHTHDPTRPEPVQVRVAGAYASGIVPTTYTCAGANCGSTGTLLKLYGDINDDGNMEYVEYHCDTTGGNLYRNAMSVTAASKPTETSSMVILPNILVNPPDPGTTVNAPCFKYQQQTVGPDTYVTDVSVTLTVQTQNLDPQTHVFQQETKALLNVSPRNIFEGWQLAGGSVTNRIQPIPADTGGVNVKGLLP